MAAPPELADLLEEVRPLARQLAVVLVRQELAGLVVGLNGAAPSAESHLDARARPPAAPNGPAAAPGPDSRGEAPTTKTCKVCAETKPTSAFDRHRHTCKRCRRNQEHERVARRQATDDEELPRTPPQPVDEGA